ncbi:hypothetical protein ACN27F_00525 [Solwaraspora sp. WMMB335]|uniref:hypothetical protein n=1 Tax=Solwaraspora sp. WMMB335 TaxID=3404118 RepID=UPI003B955FB3
MKPSPLRQTCLARLDQLMARGLRLPQPFDAVALCRQASDVLGRDIALVGMPMPPGAPFGMTFFTDTGHVIAYEQRTSRVHRDHIIAHELSHVLLGHRALALDDRHASELLLPALRSTLVHRVLNRTGVYSRGEEQEAEMMATILLESASRDELGGPTGPEPTTRVADAALEARLRQGLEPPPR